MCGIFGLVIGENSGWSENRARSVTDALFRLSESRGKEAAGLAFLSESAIRVHKCAKSASAMIRQKEYAQVFSESFMERRMARNNGGGFPVLIMGHSRLVTDGAQEVHANNQPVIANGVVGIHNGIIANVQSLWNNFPGLERKSDVDTEILLCMIRLFAGQGNSLVSAVQKTYSLIEGSASIAACFDDLDCLLLATDNGSLYWCSDDQGILIFASEKHILQLLMRKRSLFPKLKDMDIRHVRAGKGFLVNLKTQDMEAFDLNNGSDLLSPAPKCSLAKIQRSVQELLPAPTKPRRAKRTHHQGPFILPATIADAYPANRQAIAALRRCSRCILPETFPFIEFDGQGVCNYCTNHKTKHPLGLESLMEAVAPHRRNDDGPECLVTFSGGRDSSYGVHLVKNVLKMNPITYTYDWGMVTDLARRNQMRICGKLGVEHILVSADIEKKRNNIRKNVSAWLKKPDLGTVPLFMAGDKQYFYYANKVGVQTGCRLVILCENPLEATKFKSGFCGVAPMHGTQHTYTLSLLDKIRMAFYYGRQFAFNPGLLNTSLLDTFSAFVSYYFIPHNYLNLYDYIAWDEQQIETTLLGEYNWETAPDTPSTWRIGDGTAAFYNYIYYTMAGFSENDTFRSNQIREGTITRQEALALSQKENEPRYESIQWYCDVIGLDFAETMGRINKAPKLYSQP